MSGFYERTDNLITDTKSTTTTTTKSGMTDEDKCYNSSKTDSGFISGGNLTVSGEIIVSDEENNTTSSSSCNVNKLKTLQPTTTTSTSTESSDNNKTYNESHMRLDSGVELFITEGISSLTLEKNSAYNDLDSKFTSTTTNRSRSNIKSNIDSIKSIDEKQIEQQPPPWELYYEQDDDGNT